MLSRSPHWRSYRDALVLKVEDRPKAADGSPPENDVSPQPEPLQAPGDRQGMSGVEGALSAITAILAVAAISYGVGLLSAPDGSSVHLTEEALKRGPFDSYLIPGILLLVFVGGSSAVASALVLASHEWAWGVAAVCGSIVSTWVVIRLLIMGFSSYMEPLAFGAGIAIIVLSLRLRQTNAQRHA